MVLSGLYRWIHNAIGTIPDFQPAKSSDRQVISDMDCSPPNPECFHVFLWHSEAFAAGSPPGCHLHPPSPARAPRGCLPMSRRDAGGLRVRGSSSAWEKNLRTGQERFHPAKHLQNNAVRKKHLNQKHGKSWECNQQLSATAPHVRLVNFLWKPMRQASPRDVCRFPPSVVIGQYYNWTYRTLLGASSHLVSG